jgi:iron complex outermembrane receptor protein
MTSASGSSRAARAASLAAALACASAEAQQPPAGKPTVLPPVVTSATRVEDDSFDLPVAIDRVDRDVIREDKPQVNLSESLNRVPGIVVNNRQNYAQDLQISSRGFGSRATFGVRGLRLIADGIPATMPDGQGQAATFSLGSADRIEVMRGPFSTLYGNAAGGVIQIFTADGPPRPTLSGSALFGDYDTWKLGTQFGGTFGQWNTIGDLSRFQTDGYRDHSWARRDHANAKVKYDLGDRGVLTVVANVLDQPETLDALGLDRNQVTLDRRQAGTNALAMNTRKSVAQSQLGVTYALPISASDRFEARVYGGDRQVTQYLGIPLVNQLPDSHSGGVVDLDRGYGGIGVRWTRTTQFAARPLTASIGVDSDRMAERRQGFINFSGVATDLKRNEDNTVSNRDFYAQAEWGFAPRWNLLLGMRHSRVRFESEDFFVIPEDPGVPGSGNPDDSGALTFKKTTPVAGLSFKLNPEVVLYGNVGKGFETPTFTELAYRSDGGSGFNFALRPATSLHRELGVKSKLGESMRLNLSAFRIDVEDEIVVDTNLGGRSTFKNASETRREGFELAWEGRFLNGLEAALAYTWLDARYTRSFTAGTVGGGSVTVPAGNRLPGVPPQSLYGELVWRHVPSGFHAAMDARHSGQVFVNDGNTEFAGAYTVWGLRAGLEQRGRAWRVVEFVRMDNVTNKEYIGSVIVSEGNQRYYEPAPTRNFMVGVQASLEF